MFDYVHCLFLLFLSLASFLYSFLHFYGPVVSEINYTYVYIHSKQQHQQNGNSFKLERPSINRPRVDHYNFCRVTMGHCAKFTVHVL